MYTNVSADFKSSNDLIQISEKVRLSNAEKQSQGCLQAINDIVTCLNSSREKSFSIDRIKPCGSFQKGTALGYVNGEALFDIDMVVFINSRSLDEYLSFRGKYVQEMREILVKYLKIQVERTLELSLKFSYKNWSFDLLPAYNAYQGPDKTLQKQVQAVVQIIHNSNRKPFEVARDLSTSLAENAVSIVFDQDALVRSLIVLGKYWFIKKLNDVTFYGRSTTIECIAISAACRHKTSPGSNAQKMALMFREFLQILSKIREAAIEFTPPAGFTEGKFIDRSKPYILDPTNPYNNLARGIKSNPPNDQFKRISEAAVNSLGIFEGCYY